MSMESIRTKYSVPAKRGMTVRYDGRPSGSVFGVITGSTTGNRLLIRMDGEAFSLVYHPTWALRYFPLALKS